MAFSSELKQRKGGGVWYSVVLARHLSGECERGKYYCL